MEKAFAYITCAEDLLVFRHPRSPEAGIQVPAGTIRPGESPPEAALREASEETGLQHLALVGSLGTADFDMSPFGKAELHRRHFFHLELTTSAPTKWQHHESDPSDGSTQPILFEFFWARLPDDVPPLIAGHGAFLEELRARRPTGGRS